tara:strand:+ start:977 stop:1306 length:330 start_codon:yes stop_codon:yes gene_type:complete
MGDDDLTFNIDDLDVPVTYTSSAATTITLDETYLNDSGSEYTFNISGHTDSFGDVKLFENAMPNIDTVNAMCNHYPALAKAYENFKTIYKMVEQDYKGNHEDNGDSIPF